MIRNLINIWNKGSKIEYARYIERCMVVMLDDSNNRIIICFIYVCEFIMFIDFNENYF